MENEASDVEKNIIEGMVWKRKQKKNCMERFRISDYDKMKEVLQEIFMKSFIKIFAYKLYADF